MRYSIKLSYAGSGFRGWQRQPSDPSVQQCLEEALGRLLGTEIPVIGAGRTDTGVNAIGYVACFEKVGADNKTSVCTVFEAFWQPYIPSLTAICGGAADGTFPSSAAGKGPVCVPQGGPSTGIARPYDADFCSGTAPSSAAGKGQVRVPQGDPGTCIARPYYALAGAVPELQYWYFRISADRFLRNMVRAIVGTLIDVGRGKRSIADFAGLVLPAQDSGIPSPDTPASADIHSTDSGEAIPPLRAKAPSATHEGPAVRALPVRKPSLRSLAGESVPGHALFLSKIEY